MIDPILFGIAMLLLGYGACVLMDGTSRGTPSCKCGMHKAHGACLVRGTELELLSAQLTAMCPICQCNARNQVPTNRLSEVA